MRAETLRPGGCHEVFKLALWVEMGERKSMHELFEGRHFDQQVIILCGRWYPSLQAKLSRLGRDDGRARLVAGPHDDFALGTALRTGVCQTLESF